MYQLVRPLLFALETERSHDLAMAALSAVARNRLLQKIFFPSANSPQFNKPVEVMGLKFSNRVGLAAGLDKHAVAIGAFAAMGFGFVETGTVTPQPQAGNPKPRLFRLTNEQALINRFGFNSVGLDAYLTNLRRHQRKCVIGINIGKNATTPIAQAVSDYLVGMERACAFADYITVNISSPNTKGLRDLQSGEHLPSFLSALKEKQTQLQQRENRYVPLALKIAPDLGESTLTVIANQCLEWEIDAVIAINTTSSRKGVENNALSNESGGLSGIPLRRMSTHIIELLYERLDGKIPIIGVGGIFSGDDAAEKISAGASLVQIYTGLIYRGPRLVREIVLML